MSSSSSHFEGVLDRYFEEVLADQPVFATYSGLRSGEGKLGKTGEAFEMKQEKRRRRTLMALNEINPRDLSSEQHLDRLALRSQLLRECEDYQRGRPKLDPSAVDQLLNLLLHELQRGEDEPGRAAKNVRSILRLAPAYLAEAASLVTSPEPVWRRILDQTIQGAPSLFKAVKDFLGTHAPSRTDETLIDAASRACEGYHTSIFERKPAQTGSFSIGPECMSRRVRDQLGLDYTLGEIESLATAETERIGKLLQVACARFGPGKHADEIIADARGGWDPGPDLLKVYQRETHRVAEAFRSSKAVSFPRNETLEVRPVPEFMRHLYPTAAYSSPGPFAPKQRGIFWVNDLSLTKTTAAEQRAERQQHFGLSLTCAHEAYPGHHLQFITANQHPRRWRRLFAHAVFYEGWTLWCEQMMVDLKVDRSPWLRVQQLHDALWRAHRILVDLRLQTGRYSYEQGVKHLQKHLGFTVARASADVNWYTASPTVPMSYWLGRLENERLRQRLMVGRKWSLQRFNDWLLSFGTLPQSWIEKYGLD
jgi:uncharacterized protein (DUF885 family)